jgi:hypothetical protein
MSGVFKVDSLVLGPFQATHRTGFLVLSCFQWRYGRGSAECISAFVDKVRNAKKFRTHIPLPERTNTHIHIHIYLIRTSEVKPVLNGICNINLYLAEYITFRNRQVSLYKLHLLT